MLLKARLHSQWTGRATHSRYCMAAVTAAVLSLASLPALGQDGVSVRKLPPFQVFSMTGEGMAFAPVPGGVMGAGQDYRLLWTDPAIKDFVGISENGWDFSKPDGVPGFGPLPPSGAER
jgi:hypothetical protein